jgi:hypothetical protein
MFSICENMVLQNPPIIYKHPVPLNVYQTNRTKKQSFGNAFRNFEMWLEDLLIVLVYFFVEKQVFQVSTGFNSLRTTWKTENFCRITKNVCWFWSFHGCVRGDFDLFAYGAASFGECLPTLGRCMLSWVSEVEWTKKSGLGVMYSENEATKIRQNVGKYWMNDTASHHRRIKSLVKSCSQSVANGTPAISFFFSLVVYLFCYIWSVFCLFTSNGYPYFAADGGRQLHKHFA